MKQAIGEKGRVRTIQEEGSRPEKGSLQRIIRGIEVKRRKRPRQLVPKIARTDSNL